MGLAGADEHVEERRVTSAERVQEELASSWAANQPFAEVDRACVVRLSSQDEDEWGGVASLLHYSGLRGVQVLSADETMFVASDDACDIVTGYTRAAIRMLRGRVAEPLIVECSASSLLDCGFPR